MIEFQRKIMADRVRNEALAAALEKTMKPGMVVADIGSGTGLLAFLAAKLGAKECHLYEKSGDLLELSKKIAQENGITNCRFHHVHSHALKNPVKADLVISETLGNYAYEEHIIEVMEDAKKLLKPGGILIPRSLQYFAAPIVSDRLWAEINIWGKTGIDLDFSVAQEMTLHNMYVKTVKPEDLLPGAAQTWDSIDFTKSNQSIRTGSMEWHMKKTVTCYGLALFWDCELTPGVTLSTRPESLPTHWEQIVLPLLEPLKIEAGHTLAATITNDTRWKSGVNVTWTMTVKNPEGKSVAEQRMDMRKGYLE